MKNNAWNHSMEICFSEFIDGTDYDAVSEAIFRLTRTAFQKGYQLGIQAEKASNAGQQLKNTTEA